MNELKQKDVFARPQQQQRDERAPQEREIRVLDDFELLLAGGGEGDVNWP